MTEAPATPLDGLLDSLSRCLDAETVRRLAEYRVDPDIQASIDLLAEKANEGQLSEYERSQYEAAINAIEVVSILSLKALRRLEMNTA
jgi:hypothetical protein